MGQFGMRAQAKDKAARADPDQRPNLSSLRNNVPQLAVATGCGPGGCGAAHTTARKHGCLPAIKMGDGLPALSLRCTCDEQ